MSGKKNELRHNCYLFLKQVWILTNRIRERDYIRTSYSCRYGYYFNIFMTTFIDNITLSLIKNVRNDRCLVGYDCRARDRTKTFYFNILFHCWTGDVLWKFIEYDGPCLFCIINLLSSYFVMFMTIIMAERQYQFAAGWIQHFLNKSFSTIVIIKNHRHDGTIFI